MDEELKLAQKLAMDPATYDEWIHMMTIFEKLQAQEKDHLKVAENDKDSIQERKETS